MGHGASRAIALLFVLVVGLVGVPARAGASSNPAIDQPVRVSSVGDSADTASSATPFQEEEDCDCRKLRIWQVVGAFFLGVIVATTIIAVLFRWGPLQRNRR